jgi:hypothetical protein
MAKRDNNEESKPTTGPEKGDFIAPPEVEEQDEQADALPAQEEFLAATDAVRQRAS